MFLSMSDYTLQGFIKSETKHKKYDAVLHGLNGKVKFVPFGDNRYEHYRDTTGEGLYSFKDHGDKARKASYWARHKKDIEPNFYSPGYFSLMYLWR